MFQKKKKNGTIKANYRKRRINLEKNKKSKCCQSIAWLDKCPFLFGSLRLRQSKARSLFGPTISVNVSFLGANKHKK
jgi:hypothetical protein